MLFTLTTDYGAGSGYPAQVKGVIFTALPGAVVVDVSHEVPRHDVLAGALQLEDCAPWFPVDSIHLAVVDPGVGTARRAISVRDRDGRTFLAPDNGLLTPFLTEGSRVHAIEPGQAVRAPRAATFHGRDLFAPAALFLARGGDLEALGPLVRDPVRLPWPVAEHREGEILGETLRADTFGNVVTSIREADLAGAEAIAVEVGGRSARLVATYGEGGRGELLALVGSNGRLEIAVREGSAGAMLGRERGVPVRVLLARRPDFRLGE